MYKKSAGKVYVCQFIGMPAEGALFSHHRHSADLFCHYKIKQIFYMFNIFMFFLPKNCNYMLISVKVLSHYCV